MSEHAAFLQAIIEAPDDDAPRLIYADWLEEHDQGARAEFIRIQVQLATRAVRRDEYARLQHRESELSRAHREEWLAELPPLDGIAWQTFRRGFVEEIKVSTVEAFSTHAETLFAAAPVQQVSFHSLLTDTLQHLVEMPQLSRLRTLILQHQQLRNVGVLALAGSQFLSNLIEMWLPNNRIGDEGVEALAQSPYLTRLAQLDLRDNLVGDAGVAALAGSPNLTRLRTLYLVNNQVGDAGLAALAESRPLSRLRHLYVNHNRIGDEGVMALAQARSLAGLEDLDLRNNQVTGLGGRALTESPFLQNIQELLLTGNAIDAAAAEALRTRFGRRVRV